MNIKLLVSLNLISVLLLGSGSTYAASNSSLWGDIDVPVPSSKQIEQQQRLEQQQLQAEQLLIENQKTICELFTAQDTLFRDSINVSKIQDALTRAYKVTFTDYKALLVNIDAANNLYIKYRGLYLKTYCTAAK